MKQIATLLGIVTILFGSWFFMDARWAKCQEMRQIEKRLDYDIESNRLFRMRDQKREYSRDFPDLSKAPMAVQRQIQQLDEDLDMQREKVKRLEAK